MEILNDKNYWCHSGSSYVLEFVLPGWMINEIAHPGPNDADVERNAKSDIVQKAFERFSDKEIAKTYDEVFWDRNSPVSRQEMIEYILWDAVWNAVDDDELEEAEV